MLALGLGCFGTHLFWGFQGASMPLFLSGFTDSKSKIGMIISLAGVAGCIAPPIVGYISDRTSSRFGRRKPYIFFGMVCVCLSLLFMPHIHSLAIVALVSGVMYLSLVSAEATYFALLPDTVPQEQRSTASGIVHLFASVGLIAYYLLAATIWDTHRTEVFTAVALLPLGFMLLTIAFVKEPKVQLEKPAERGSPLSYLKGLAKERNAIIFFMGQAFWWLALWTFSSFLTLFMVEVLGASEGKSMLAPLVFSVTSVIFMLPFGMMGDRVGRKGILTFMLAFWAMAFLLMGFVQSVTHALIVAGIAGIPFAAIRGVGYAFMLDLIPEERTAEFVGLNYLSQTSSLILGALVGGILIDLFGYRSIFFAAAVFTIIGLLGLQFVQPRPDSSEAHV
jgi:maltose/moltooligosaccharide transporter